LAVHITEILQKDKEFQAFVFTGDKNYLRTLAAVSLLVQQLGEDGEVAHGAAVLDTPLPQPIFIQVAAKQRELE